MSKKEAIKSLIKKLHKGMTPEEGKEEFREIIKDTSADEIAKAEEELVKEGMPREEIQRLCEVHIAVFKEQLGKSTFLVPAGHPLQILMEEHRILLEYTEKLNLRCLHLYPPIHSVSGAY